MVLFLTDVLRAAAGRDVTSHRRRTQRQRLVSADVSRACGVLGHVPDRLRHVHSLVHAHAHKPAACVSDATDLFCEQTQQKKGSTNTLMITARCADGSQSLVFCNDFLGLSVITATHTLLQQAAFQHRVSYSHTHAELFQAESNKNRQQKLSQEVEADGLKLLLLSASF